MENLFNNESDGMYGPDLVEYKSQDGYKEFYFEPLDVTLEDIMIENKVPQKKWIEIIIRSVKRKRESLEELSREEYQRIVNDYYRQRDKKHEIYIREKINYFESNKINRYLND
ncbi:hypothetical protein ACQPU1_09310 [Clostridium paraputrificum]|uniref:hypothetical protein n=1 Tax=Clostridium TaxID=1485 RepID=UPI003D34547C